MTDKPHPDMRDRQQVAVRMTDQFAKDLNLLMASYKLSDVSYIVRESVSAQADAVRQRMHRLGMHVQTEVTDEYQESQKEET